MEAAGPGTVRVLATIPEIVWPSASSIAAPAEVAADLVAAAARRPIEPRPADRRRRRHASKPGFPFVSAAALAVITAVIWSLVAAREAGKPAARRPDVRLAAEPDLGPQPARTVQ